MTDLRFALRQLLHRPGLAVVAILTLAVGLGASAAIFSVVNGVLLKPLPYPDADRIVTLAHLSEGGASSNLPDPDFLDLQQRSRSFEAMAQYGAGIVSVSGGNQPTRTVRARVSSDFFAVMGVQPVQGRVFAEAEPVVLVSEHYWRTYLDASPDLSGVFLRIDETEHAVVGVMPAGFAFPDGSDIWTPRELMPYTAARTAHNWQAIGRLQHGVSLDAAVAELEVIATALRAEHGQDITLAGVGVTTLHEHVVGALRPMLMVLQGAALLLALIAWANVASLSLARVTARERELAIRVSVGAGRRRLVSQFLTEAVLLSVLGTVAALVLAAWALDIFRMLMPSGLPRVENVALDAWVIGFTFGMALVAALVLGLVVAAKATRNAIAGAASERSVAGARMPATRALVVAQVALALVLVIGTGLLARSFASVMQVDPGYRTENILVMRLALPWPQSEQDGVRQTLLHQTLLEQVRGFPGVERAGITNLAPMTPGMWSGTFLKLERPDEIQGFEDWGNLMRVPGRNGQAHYRIVSDGWFETMGMRLVAGRFLESEDAGRSVHAAVVSESLAREQWPNEDPLGKLIHFGNMDGIMAPFTIVGVVSDIHHAGLENPTAPMVYAHFIQRQPRLAQAAYTVATHGDPLALIPQMRQAVQAIDPALPPAFTTMNELLSSSLARRRFSLALLAAFGVSALVLAIVGVYGAVAFSVSRRTREIGLRMAIGASADGIGRMVVTEGLRTCAIGTALGLAVALLLGRAAQSLVWGVSVFDPMTYLVGPMVLLSAAALAAWVPARRAARISPMEALRDE